MPQKGECGRISIYTYIRTEKRSWLFEEKSAKIQLEYVAFQKNQNFFEKMAVKVLTNKRSDAIINIVTQAQTTPERQDPMRP